MNDKVWICWEEHRRSKELSSAIGAEYLPITVSGSRTKRYLILPFRTLWVLIRKRPNLVFCQNPSMVLTFILCMVKSIFGFKLCVDRHSNFKFETENSKKLVWRFFHFLSRYTVKKADVTIVTNQYLKDLCERWGGDAVILQDKMPVLGNPNERLDRPDIMVEGDLKHVMFITMFDDDEPIHEIIECCKKFEGVVSYLTGNYKKMISEDERIRLQSKNIILGGFLSDQDYLALIKNVDVVVVLTIKDFILNCGAYEAFSVNKSVVLSNTPTIREYFRKGVIYVDPEAEKIYEGIVQALEKTAILERQIQDFKPIMEADWYKRFAVLKTKLEYVE